jgi:hypothetical protein
VGHLNDKNELHSAVASWQWEHGTRILYMIEMDGHQYAYADYEQNILENASLDQKVVYRSATKDELQVQLVASVQEYVKMVAGSVDALKEKFYGGPDGETWQSLVDFLEQLELLQQALVKLGAQYADNSRFSAMLAELLQAVQSKDSLTVGDLLTFQWATWLKELDARLKACSA